MYFFSVCCFFLPFPIGGVTSYKIYPNYFANYFARVSARGRLKLACSALKISLSTLRWRVFLCIHWFCASFSNKQLVWNMHRDVHMFLISQHTLPLYCRIKQFIPPVSFLISYHHKIYETNTIRIMPTTSFRSKVSIMIWRKSFFIMSLLCWKGCAMNL